MLLLNADTTADLTDLYKSVLLCIHLNLDFAVGENEEGDVLAVDAEGALGGLQVAFDIMGLAIPEITEQDIAEFCEVNGI